MSTINSDKEVVPGLTSADVRKIADQIFNKTDGNHPQLNTPESRFLNILKNGKSNISSSAVFIRKADI